MGVGVFVCACACACGCGCMCEFALSVVAVYNSVHLYCCETLSVSVCVRACLCVLWRNLKLVCDDY